MAQHNSRGCCVWTASFVRIRADFRSNKYEFVRNVAHQDKFVTKIYYCLFLSLRSSKNMFSSNVRFIFNELKLFKVRWISDSSQNIPMHLSQTSDSFSGAGIHSGSLSVTTLFVGNHGNIVFVIDYTQKHKNTIVAYVFAPHQILFSQSSSYIRNIRKETKKEQTKKETKREKNAFHSFDYTIVVYS